MLLYTILFIKVIYYNSLKNYHRKVYKLGYTLYIITLTNGEEKNKMENKNQTIKVNLSKAELNLIYDALQVLTHEDLMRWANTDLSEKTKYGRSVYEINKDIYVKGRDLRDKVKVLLNKGGVI
jgi:hypothetical protein